jgi:hypothetical protein
MPTAFQYKVVVVTPSDPKVSVKSEDIERELNRWGQQGWELFIMQEHTIDEIDTPSESKSARISTIVRVTLVFKMSQHG